MADKKRLVRVSTIPLSLKMFCKDLLLEINDDYDVVAVSSSGAELDQLADLGIKVEAVEMSRNISLLSDIVSLLRLVSTFRRLRPDIVHSITPKAGLLSMIAARLAGVPVRIHSFTGLLFPTATGIKQKILKTTDRITCACATHVLPEGHGVMADLLNAGITKKSMRVLGYGNVRGVDMDYFALTEEVMARGDAIARDMGISPQDFVFVFVGRIVRDKGISELANAFSRIVAKRKNTHIIYIGVQEPDTDPLPNDTLKTLADTPNVHFSSGWVEDVRPYYSIADALVFPSYREGFPNVVLEAGAMSLPSIVTDINGAREIIEQNVNGHIVPVRDAESLYKAMLMYVDDPEKIHEMGQKCRAIIYEKYDAKYVRRCLREFYDSL